MYTGIIGTGVIIGVYRWYCINAVKLYKIHMYKSNEKRAGFEIEIHIFLRLLVLYSMFYDHRTVYYFNITGVYKIKLHNNNESILDH